MVVIRLLRVYLGELGPRQSIPRVEIKRKPVSSLDKDQHIRIRVLLSEVGTPIKTKALC